MRSSRNQPSAKFPIFYCVSTLAEGKPTFGETDRASLVELLSRCSAFTGIEVIAWAVTGRALHTLLRTPRKHKLNDQQLLERIEGFYGEIEANRARTKFSRFSASSAKGREARKFFTRKMGDMSGFIRIVHQRFGIGYRKRRDETFSKIWHDRHKTIPVENRPEFIAAAAVWIHAAPVRDSLCERADRYSFSSFGEARNGIITARNQILNFTQKKSWREAANAHRKGVANHLADETEKLPKFIGTNKFGEAHQAAEESRKGRSHSEVKQIASTRLQSLKRFQKRFGHTRVPPNWEEDLELARWVRDMVKKRRIGTLSENQIARLDEIGMDWDQRASLRGRPKLPPELRKTYKPKSPTQFELAWERRFEELREFQKRTGHTRVDRSSKKLDSLANWISAQRRKCRDGKLKPEQIEKLNEIGIKWETNRRS